MHVVVALGLSKGNCDDDATTTLTPTPTLTLTLTSSSGGSNGNNGDGQQRFLIQSKAINGKNTAYLPFDAVHVHTAPFPPRHGAAADLCLGTTVGCRCHRASITPISIEFDLLRFTRVHF